MGLADGLIDFPKSLGPPESWDAPLGPAVHRSPAGPMVALCAEAWAEACACAGTALPAVSLGRRRRVEQPAAEVGIHLPRVTIIPI